MADSRRQEVLAEFLTRLATILQADGFNTDAGKALWLGIEPPFGPDDPLYAIAVVVGDDDSSQSQWQGESLYYRLPIEVKSIAQVDEAKPDQAWITVEAVLQDIKRAVELPGEESRTFERLLAGFLERGPTRTLPREPGSLTVGAGITYFAPIKEKWGEP